MSGDATKRAAKRALDVPTFEYDVVFSTELPAKYTMPTTATLRPICGVIAPEPDEANDWGKQTLAMRYQALTTELPLMGAQAMRPTRSGTLAIVETLRLEAAWFEPVIARIEQQLEQQLRIGRLWVKLRPMLLIGNPGTGRSWFAKRVAELSGCGFGVADLAGGMDAALIHGNPRGWVAAQPIFPALIMNQCGTANTICIVEELDKAGGSERYGDPIASLLLSTPV